MASIRKRGSSYQITVSNGRDIYGNQIFERVTWKPDPNRTEKQNERELARFTLEFEEKVRNGKYLDGEKVTFQDFAEKWLEEYAKIQLEPTTVDLYTNFLYTHIMPAIGHLKLARVQPAHLNKLYTDMLQSRKDNREGGYSPTSIRRCHAVISSIFSTAAHWNIVSDNPCERVKPPKQTNTTADIKHFTVEETGAFLTELDDETAGGLLKLQHNIFFQFCIFCGLRRGEAVALLWSDVDLHDKTVSITKSTTIVNGKPYTKAPKNHSSARVLSVPEHIIKQLKRYRLEYNTYRLSIGCQWVERADKQEYLFIQWNGAQMYPSTPYSVFKSVIAHYNDTHTEQLPDIPLHGLRHTSATLLISQNVDVRTVSNRLGHAQTSTTMNIYSHSLQKKDVAASNALEELLIKKSNC